MSAGSWLATLGGVILVAGTLVDVVVAVLHADQNGAIGARLQRLVWRACLALSRRRLQLRRPLLALAGPVMIVATFALWVVLFVVGFALIYWPHLHVFRTDAEIVSLTFIDALYYSGVTGTVLGYGDITPLAPAPRIVALAQSSLGFALLTGIVTYLLTVVSGVAERNALATRVRLASGGTSDGVQLVIRCLACEPVDDFRSRLQELLISAQKLQEKTLQFPVLELFYRARDPQRDPEPLLIALADLALACRIVAERDAMRSLRPLAEELERTAEASMQVVLQQLARRQRHELVYRDDDRAAGERHFERVRQRLARHFLPGASELDCGLAEQLTRFAARSRAFADELDAITQWRVDHPAILVEPDATSARRAGA
jgi:hypothetical protein